MTPDNRSSMRPRPGAAGEARHATHLRGLNLDRVLGVAMDRPGFFTRSELIDATGLSAPTVGSLASQLIRAGLIRDLGTGPSRGGRRPSFMEFNARHGFAVGIDLGPSSTRLALADLRGERLADKVMPTPVRLGPAALLSRVSIAVRALLRKARVPPGRLLAVAAGAPGAVDRERGILVALAPNLKDWSQVPVGAILERGLGAPVVVENDVNLAVLAERWRGAARGHDNCAFITVGTGIGAGIVVDGELHRGYHSLAGEIALMSMGPQYVGRDFGSRGCLETLAGLKGLAQRWPGASARDGDEWVAALFEAALRGEGQARKMVDEAATLIGIATANLMLVLDPSLIVFGGPLATQGDLFVHEVRRVVRRIVPTPSQIVVSSLGDEAPLWGSLLVATTEARERLRRRLRGGNGAAAELRPGNLA
jgi:predicted NBD/HSP70 family sugar kinase